MLQLQMSRVSQDFNDDSASKNGIGDTKFTPHLFTIFPLTSSLVAISSNTRMKADKLIL